MHLELSRPYGDVSRWEKVYSRLTLLNEQFPYISKNNKKCNIKKKRLDIPYEVSEFINQTIKSTLLLQNVIFFGDYALQMIDSDNKKIYDNGVFRVISKTPKIIAHSILSKLKHRAYNKIKYTMQFSNAIGDIIPASYNIYINEQIILKVYNYLGCHNYNNLTLKNGSVHKIASIDTILSLYLAIIYTNINNDEMDDILCSSQRLFTLLIKNKNFNKGLYRRFNINCYGIQKMMADIMKNKSNMYAKFKHKNTDKISEEYQKVFLNYIPNMHNNNNKTTKNKTTKNKTTKNKTAKNKTTKNKTIKNKTTKNKTAKNKTTKNKTTKNTKNKTTKNKTTKNKN
jgi:hypothetical protein